MSDLPSARALPRGFRFAAVSAGLKKRGHTGSLDVALIVSDAPASAAAVFTQNLVQAPPVILSRAHVHASPDSMRAVIVNSGNANCSVGPGGMAASRATAEHVAKILRCRVKQVVVCSTGVLGVPLPVSSAVHQMWVMANQVNGAGSDFTEIVKIIEGWAGVEVRNKKK